MQVKKIMTILMTLSFAGLAVLLSASYAIAAKPTLTVNGGGTAVVIESVDDDFEGTVTNFAVGAHLREDGTASGHFTCEIPGIVTVSGKLTEGELLNDGSVKFTGSATIVEVGVGVFQDEPITVTFTEGGPGVGMFLYDDTIVADPGDLEVVVTGNIKIKN